MSFATFCLYVTTAVSNIWKTLSPKIQWNEAGFQESSSLESGMLGAAPLICSQDAKVFGRDIPRPDETTPAVFLIWFTVSTRKTVGMRPHCRCPPPAYRPPHEKGTMAVANQNLPLSVLYSTPYSISSSLEIPSAFNVCSKTPISELRC